VDVHDRQAVRPDGRRRAASHAFPPPGSGGTGLDFSGVSAAGASIGRSPHY